MRRTSMHSRIPIGLVLVAASFLLFTGYLVAASLTRRTQLTFPPTILAPRPLPPGSTVVDTVTIDARDTRAWRFFDFDRRSAVLPPDTAGWDLAIRRFHIIAADGIADLGPVPLNSVTAVPDTGYVPNRAGRDTTNPAIQRWYDYNFLTHLLKPKAHVYGVRTREGRYATVEVLSYYCPGLKAGCLTVRYRYPVALYRRS